MTPEQLKEILRPLTQNELIEAQKRIKKEVKEIKKMVERIRRVN